MFSRSETKFPELAKTPTVGLSPHRALASRATPARSCVELQHCSAEGFYYENSNIYVSEGRARMGLWGQQQLQSTVSEGETVQLSLPCTGLAGEGGQSVLLFMREVKVGRSDR